MRFLADENLHAEVVRWLRSRGHDVTYAAETAAGEQDESLLRRAREEGRILVTDDKDFGELVVRKGLSTAGVLLLRQRNPLVRERIARLNAIWGTVEARVAGAFAVVSDNRIRVRPLHSGGTGGEP